MKKCIIYTRVSTIEQANHGFSLQRQKEECIDFAKNNSYEVQEIFEEPGESAKTTDRTELQKLMEYCAKHKKEINALILWKIDRLARNMQDYYFLSAYFAKLDIDILSATKINDNTSVGKLTRNMLGAIAQFENDQKSERVIAGMKQAFSEGKWLWKAPYGYKMINGDMFPDEKIAPIVKQIFEWYGTGLYNQVQIRNLLEKENVFIKPSTMFHLLRQSLYCGRMYCASLCSGIVKGDFEPIISEELFDKVQILLNGTIPSVTAYTRNSAEFPLRQFILCPICGEPLTASKSTGYQNKKYAYYHCYNKDCHSQIRIPKDKLEACFVTYLEDFKLDGLNMEEFKKELKEIYNNAVKNTKNQITKLKKDLTEVQDKKDKLIDMYIAGKIKESDYNLKSAKLEAEEQHIQNCLLSIDLPQNDFNKCAEYVCNSLENIDKVWLESDLDTKQRLQKLIFPKGLTYENEGFRTDSKCCLFTKKGALMAPDFKMVPPREFESLSTP